MVVGVLTGSRYAILFPAAYFSIIYLAGFFQGKLKSRLNWSALSFGSITLLFLVFPVATMGGVFEYLSGIDKLIALLSGQGGGSNYERIILLETGIDCFLNGNILLATA